jgi:hypothetical protein
MSTKIIHPIPIKSVVQLKTGNTQYGSSFSYKYTEGVIWKSKHRYAGSPCQYHVYKVYPHGITPTSQMLDNLDDVFDENALELS